MTKPALGRIMRACQPQGKAVAACLVALLLSACASAPPTFQQQQRDGIKRLGRDIATRLIKSEDWGTRSNQQTVLVTPPLLKPRTDSAHALHIQPDELRNSIINGLLGMPHPPQAIAYTAAQDTPLPASLWVMDSRVIDYEPTQVGGQTFYPYRIEIRLGHNNGRPHSMVVEGALDERGLPTKEPDQ